MSTSSMPWYPGEGNDLQHFVYTSSLSQKNNELFNKVSNMLTEAHRSISTQRFIDNTYAGLDRLWKTERQAEKAFIQKYLKTDIDYGNLDEVKSILKAINLIMQDEAVLRDSLKRIQELELGEDGKYKGKNSAIYNLTNFILPDAINDAIRSFFETVDIDHLGDDKTIETLSNKILESLRKKIDDPLVNGYNSAEGEVYKSFLEYLERTQSKDELVRKIFEAYGFSPEKIAPLFQKASKSKDMGALKKALSAKTKIGGNISEIITDDFLKKIGLAIKGGNGSINVEVSGTGNLNFMKADHIIYIGEVDVNTELLNEIFSQSVKDTSKTTTSVRRQNIIGMQAMLDTIKEARESIVEISDKNYKLTGEALGKIGKQSGGFAAETPNLLILPLVLEKTSINESKLDDLIFILANSGKSFINELNYQDAINVVALNIGSFLFDDVFITEALDDYKSSLSIIHLFNLNGIYVPLSVFLEGAAVTFNNNRIDFEDYVKINFSVEQMDKPNPEQDGLTEDDWHIYYNEKLKKSKLSIHFFGGFIEFIKQNMPI